MRVIVVGVGNEPSSKVMEVDSSSGLILRYFEYGTGDMISFV